MDFVSTSIFTHVIAILILLGIMIFNIYSVLNITNFIYLTRRLKVMTPIYHFFNIIVAYTGAIVAAYSHDLSPTVILMIIATILIMILEIKRYKKMRVIKSTDKQKQEEFTIYAKKIYLAEISAIVFTFIISLIF